VSRTFSLWVSGCSHVGTDLRYGRTSLADAIRDSEAEGEEVPENLRFHWDRAIHLGDFSGNQGSPRTDEGQEVVKQFSALARHRREDFYCIAGNHDATFADEETQWWFRRYVDPEGLQSEYSGVDASNRPSPIEGTWERYSFRVGNILFLMMSDRNDVGPPVGRGERGGYPAGMVTTETFAWWRSQVEQAGDAIVVTAHHHMLKETTTASGPWEGFRKDENGEWKGWYHGYFPDGGPEGASYLYWLDDTPDAGAFESYLAEHPRPIDLWLGGHTHTHPDDRTGGRALIETKWGVHFVNCASLSKYHANKTTIPMSRLLEFTEGSATVRVRCYLHTDDHAPKGWYPSAERTLSLSQPFHR